MARCKARSAPHRTQWRPSLSPGVPLDAHGLGCSGLAAASGLPQLTLHGLRLSHTSHLVASAHNPKLVSARLGHSSVAFTMDRYGHCDSRSASVGSSSGSSDGGWWLISAATKRLPNGRSGRPAEPRWVT
jgi:hypothetical protein